MGRKPIEDEFTDLPVSRQRKHQLRNPDKHRALKKRHRDAQRRKQRDGKN